MRGSNATLKITLLAVMTGWMAGATAQDIAQGALAAAIRESGNPCQRVIESSSAGGGTYIVTCNSGKFKVTQKKDGSFDVAPM